jgi:hypothetical protein
VFVVTALPQEFWNPPSHAGPPLLSSLPADMGAVSVNLAVFFILHVTAVVGQGSSGSIATRYGLDGPGINSCWGARCSAPVHTGLGAHPASYTMGIGSFPTVRQPGHGNHPSPCSAEVKERIGL